MAAVAFAFAVTTYPKPDNSIRADKPGYADKDHQKEESFWQTATNDPVAIFTLALVLIAFSQAGLFVWQLRLMKDGVDDARVAANAARDGALAATDSANTAKRALVDSERAYVHYTGAKWISHRKGTSDGELFWRIRPWWTNTGNTPTRSLGIVIRYFITDQPLPDGYDFAAGIAEPVTPCTIHPRGFIESHFHDIDGLFLQTIKDGSAFLYIFGIATYRDVFPNTPQRITKFCVQATNITGDPCSPWHAENNRLDIMFAHVGRRQHNCSDEDCEI